MKQMAGDSNWWKCTTLILEPRTTGPHDVPAKRIKGTPHIFVMLYKKIRRRKVFMPLEQAQAKHIFS